MTIAASCDAALQPDGKRTVLRPFRVTDPSREGDPEGRTAEIVRRILGLDADAAEAEFSSAMRTLASRHHDVEAALQRRYDELAEQLPELKNVDDVHARLIGIFFSEEYSIEAAALFNPSVVAHFDQSGVADGDTRIILSLRGIGEGHISSLIFQTGVWRGDGTTVLDPRGAMATGPQPRLPRRGSGERTATLTFPDVPISDRVIYPFLPSQGRGIEDARFCRFVDDDGSADYRCTFTAFDGMDTRQAVFRTQDFTVFEGRRLDGDLAFRKGAAWFPRRLGGRYHMLGRLDEESVFVLASDNPDRWDGGVAVVRPRYAWEFVQMGNCGSPIEIDEGWLVLTHGVGRARRYCVGAALLDRDDPTRLLARTSQPLLEPTDQERGGYVPNVVYSCGGLVRGRSLLLPYGIADNYAAFATVDLDDLVKAMD